MFVPIEINSDDLLSQFSLSQKEVEQVIDYTIKEIAAQFYIRWQEQAKLDLTSTRDRYVSNLSLFDTGRMSGGVMLDYSKDPLIKMIEEGASAFDMKDGFERSNKKHRKEDGGWYLTIPFKLGTPGALETSGFANIMPSQIYDIAKNKPVSPITERSKGITKPELGKVPEQYAIPKVRAAIVIPKSQTFEEYKHKASIYQGVYKQKDLVTGQTSYGSFRRVSDKSDSNSWIFPGLEARGLAEKTMERFETGMQIVLEQAMDSALIHLGIE